MALFEFVVTFFILSHNDKAQQHLLIQICILIWTMQSKIYHPMIWPWTIFKHISWNYSLWLDEVWQQPGRCRWSKRSFVHACNPHEHSSWSDHQHDQPRPNPGHNQRLHCQQRPGHHTGMSNLDALVCVNTILSDMAWVQNIYKCRNKVRASK